MVELLRKMSPEQKARIAFERMEEARQFRKRTEHLRNKAES